MIPVYLGIIIIIAAFIISIIYAKMILIWRDVMLKKNEKLIKDFEKLRTYDKSRRIKNRELC